MSRRPCAFGLWESCRRASRAVLVTLLLALGSLVVFGAHPHAGHALGLPSVNAPSHNLGPVSTPPVRTPPVSLPPVSPPSVPKLPVPSGPISVPSVPSIPSLGGSPGQSSGGYGSSAGSSAQSASGGGSSGTESSAAPSAQDPAGSPSGGSQSGGTAADRHSGSVRSHVSRRPLSQQELTNLVDSSSGCLSNLPARQQRTLELRTGFGLRHSYDPQQVARILGISLAKERQLEGSAVAGLENASNDDGCGASEPPAAAVTLMAEHTPVGIVDQVIHPGRATLLAEAASTSGALAGGGATAGGGALAGGGVTAGGGATAGTGTASAQQAAKPAKPAGGASAKLSGGVEPASPSTPAPQLRGDVVPPPADQGGAIWWILGAAILALMAAAALVLARRRVHWVGSSTVAAWRSRMTAAAGWRPRVPAAVTGWRPTAPSLRPRIARVASMVGGLLTLPLAATGVRGRRKSTAPESAPAEADGAPTQAAPTAGRTQANGALRSGNGQPRTLPTDGHGATATDGPAVALGSAAVVGAEAAGGRRGERGPERPAGAPSTEAIEDAAAFDLAQRLERQGDMAGAEAAYRRAARLGHTAAAFHLGGILAGRGDHERAEAAYRRAEEGGHADAASNLGVVLEQRGDLEGAEAAYRRADEQGHAVAAFNLGGLLAERGDWAAAEEAYARADSRGDADAAYILGLTLEMRGERDGAEAAYRRAEERGHGDVARKAHAAVLELPAHR